MGQWNGPGGKQQGGAGAVVQGRGLPRAASTGSPSAEPRRRQLMHVVQLR